MKFYDHPRYAAYESQFYCVTFNKKNGKLAFFGVESGGRDRDKRATFNQLMPSFGAAPGSIFRTKKPVIDVSADENGVSAKFSNGSYNVRFDGIKSFLWDINGASPKDIFTACLSVKTGMPSIWAKTKFRKVTKETAPKDPLIFAEAKYELPMIVYFPDYGRVQIDCDDSSVYCEEKLTKSSEYTGLGLGYLNYGHHTNMNSLHFGYSKLTFKSKSTADKYTLKFTILDELYPKLPFADADDHDWDGLRRCWMNNFTLDRNTFTMGDNIGLHGVGHLCVHSKADMLQFLDKEDPHVKRIVEVFERQVSTGMLYAQADDGEISFGYFGHKKGKEKMCAFIDSTPSNIIGLTGLSNWNMPLAKKLLPHAIKAADFIISLDNDGDGIAEVPFSGNSFNAPSEPPRQRNWWDNFAFGHKDVFFNLLCHRALRELSALCRKCKRITAAKRFERHLAKFDANFLKTFYNPETGVIAGWISADGKVHDYMFTFATSMSIDEGLVDKEHGRQMIEILLAQMEKMGFGKFKYGIPGPTKPVELVDTIDWPCMGDWPNYENGGLCGMNGFHFLTAMYRVGLRDKADSIFKSILHTFETQHTHSGLMPGYCQSIDWRTMDGNPCGYNYLADNYYFTLAAFTGRAGLPHPAVATN